MQRKNKKRIGLALGVLLSGFLTIPFLSSCSNSNGIVFANYESYISPNVQSQLNKNFNISYKWCATNEVILNKFPKYYDIAVPTSYGMKEMASKGELEPIDWTKFHIPGINNATDALKLFTPEVQRILTSTIITLPDGSPCHNMLEYGVPYFLQDLVLGYKGNAIDSLSQIQTPGEHDNQETTWNQVFDVISPIKNSNVDDRFYPNASKERPSIAIIGDDRTLYSLSRLLQTRVENGPEGIAVNPDESKIEISDFETTYNYLSEYFYNNYFHLYSDSGQALYSLALPVERGGTYAGILFSGDIQYAAAGAEINGVKYSVNNFHVVRPKNTFVAIDMVVINKKNHDNEEKLNKIYDIVKKVCLDLPYNSSDATIISNSELTSLANTKANDDIYQYLPLENFSYLMYNSPLAMVDELIKNGYNGSDESKFFYYDYDSETAKLLTYIYPIKENNNVLLEDYISNKAKSNLYHAYLKLKTLI